MNIFLLSEAFGFCLFNSQLPTAFGFCLFNSQLPTEFRAERSELLQGRAGVWQTTVQVTFEASA
jgi:hypothetical protein